MSRKMKSFSLAASAALVLTGCFAYAGENEEIDIETLVMMQNAEVDHAEEENTQACADGVIYRADLYSITIPAQLDAIAEVSVNGNTIAVCDKVSKENGYGGFVGELGLYDSNADYGCLPNYALYGTLTSPEGQVRHVVLQYPTDVQFDWEHEEARENYQLISAGMESIVTSLTPAEGYTYTAQDAFDNTGVYTEILDSLTALVTAQADMEELSSNGFSSLYKYLYDNGNTLDQVGYTYLDINHDGYQELILGSMDDEDTIVYDLFTTVGGEVKHVFSSAERDRYYLTSESGMIREESSGGAAYSRIDFYLAEAGSEELCKQVGCVYDAERDADAPYFMDYSFEDEPTPVSEEEWTQMTDRFPGVRAEGMRPLGTSGAV